MIDSSPLAAFEAHVRLAVDPISASPARKQAMREELLSHLVGAYEQEIERGSPESAIAAARDRFGDLGIIRLELGHSVPMVERWIYVIFKRESQMRIWILVGLALIAIGMGVVLPALAQIRSGAKLQMSGAVALSVGVAMVILGLWTIILKIAKRLMRKEPATPR